MFRIRLLKFAIAESDDNRWLALDITTDNVKANCDDLKVLGKGDFKALIKWRIALREEVSTTKRLSDYVLTSYPAWT